MRDHGGNLDQARARFGGAAAEWIDLSTGINRVCWPVPALPPDCWTALPQAGRQGDLIEAARAAYGTQAPVLPVAGAQAAIQMLPQILPRGSARVLAPTYNEHAACLRAAGWQVTEVATPDALAGADLAVVVNPNNPDGRCHAPGALRALAGQVGRLVVDESFCDARPDLSVAPWAGEAGLVVLRSFGKFYGLAGLRLGFVLADGALLAGMAARLGPWAVSGPAQVIGAQALRDRDWQAATVARLRQETLQLDALAARRGWTLAGGCELFRLYHTPDAAAAQDHLARARIWSRIFPWSSDLIRLGLPGGGAEWARLAAALA